MMTDDKATRVMGVRRTNAMDDKYPQTRRSSTVAWFVAVSAFAMLALGGCDLLFGPEVQENPNANQSDDSNDGPPAPRSEGPSVTADEQEDYERPEYPSSIRRNPFMPNRDVVQPERNLDQGTERALEPLEQYGLGELRLVAIISEVAVPKAMFLDPDGFGHTVKEGDRIGENGGVIADIRDNEVEVREARPDDDDEDGGHRLTIELRDERLADRDDDELTEEERESLKRLLQSEEGRRALENLEANDGQRRRGDDRFRSVAPPD